MRIEYLQEFVHFSKSLNITQAAQELFTTQSTLSKHLRQIERALGAQLVVTCLLYTSLAQESTVAGAARIAARHVHVAAHEDHVHDALAGLGSRELLVECEAPRNGCRLGRGVQAGERVDLLDVDLARCV